MFHPKIAYVLTVLIFYGVGQLDQSNVGCLAERARDLVGSADPFLVSVARDEDELVLEQLIPAWVPGLGSGRSRDRRVAVLNSDERIPLTLTDDDPVGGELVDRE